MGARNDVSELLDVFGQTFGSLLFRNTEYWAAITPGEETQVLTIGPDGKPAWLPSTGGSSTPGGFACSNPSVLSSSAFAAKGTLIKPQVDLLIPSFVLGFTEVSGATYKVQAWHTDAFQLDELLAESDELTGSYDGFIYRKFSFTTPAALPAGQLNVFLLIRTDATSTTPVGLWTQSADPVSMPVYQTDNYVRLASIDPQVGDFLDHGATGFAYGATFSL